MTRFFLIKELKAFCEKQVKNLLYPPAVQKGDTKKVERAPELYAMRLPNSREAKKFAPYIIIQLADSLHVQNESEQPEYSATIRFIFCVYEENESEGAMRLLNLMDLVQEALLRQVKIGNCYRLDVHKPLDMLIYPDDTAPYFVGEMVGTFNLPATKREVNLEF